VISCRKERKKGDEEEEIDNIKEIKDTAEIDLENNKRGSDKYDILQGTNSLMIVEKGKDSKHMSQPTSGEYKVSKEVLAVPELKDIEFLERLGGGQYGEVYRGLAFGGTTQVAVKKLKIEAHFNDMIEEAKVLLRLRHPNCVHFLGIYRSNEGDYLVTEHMPNGSLDIFIQKHSDELDLENLLKMAIDAASGMNYLHTQNVIHRDLSARNLLVDNDMKVKVGDFGMSKILENEFYKSSDHKIPIKWSAPEVLEFRKYSPASDSWSMGIVLYEIITRGRAPYTGMSNNEVVTAVVEEDYRMPKPKACPDEIYTLMSWCWKKKSIDRPSFKQIVDSLRSYLEAIAANRALDLEESQHENEKQLQSRNYEDLTSQQETEQEVDLYQ